MGTDKALLAWSGETLLQRAISIAREACSRVFICGPRSRYGGFGDIVEDLEAGRGPLSGIQAALCTTQTDLNLILSVDLPLMTTEFLTWLLQEARSGEQMITIPQVLGRLQPLCAVYHRQMGQYVDQALAQGEFKVTRLTSRVATRIIAEEEVHAAGFAPYILTNLNTPEEYASLRQAGSPQSQAGASHE